MSAAYLKEFYVGGFELFFTCLTAYCITECSLNNLMCEMLKRMMVGVEKRGDFINK